MKRETILLILVILAARFHPQGGMHDYKVDDFILAGIIPNISIEELEIEKGNPTTIEYDEKNASGNPGRYIYAGFSVYTRFGRARIIYLESSAFTTYRGLKVGDGTDAILKLYPKARKENYNPASGERVVRYIVEHEMDANEKYNRIYRLTFRLGYDGKIDRISSTQFWNDGSS